MQSRESDNFKATIPNPNPVPSLNEITNVSELIIRLTSADERWRPKIITMANGSKHYTYQKRINEGTLTLDEVKERMKNPMNFEAEKLL